MAGSVPAVSEPKTYEMSEQEFKAISSLEAGKRYDHLIGRVTDWEWIWVLEGDAGPVSQADEEGSRYVAIWPHRRYAEASAIDEWAGAQPRAIEIHEWVAEWLPRFADEGLMLSAFPTPEGQGYIVPPLGMKTDIEEELSLYE